MGVLDRLKRRREFLVVASQGRKWAAPGLILQAWQREPGKSDAPPRSPASSSTDAPSSAAPAQSHLPADTVSRVGFTVSRKVGNAVTRNRARRRLKAAAEAVMPSQARAAYDYVIIGRQQTMTRSFPALLQDLETALRKTGAHVSGNAPDARTEKNARNDRGRRA